MNRGRNGRFSPIETDPDYAVARALNECRQNLMRAIEENRQLNRTVTQYRNILTRYGQTHLDGAGKRTRGKLRSKSRAKFRAKSRKKRRRKRGGTRKNAGPEKPIVGYNYIINIYHGGQGEKVLRYGNVTGTYMGLAEEFHDGFDSIEGKKYMFKARVPDEDGDEIETIGEIVRLIGPPHINVDGGRRKKRTKKRRKSKGRKRRRKNRKKRTKRRR